MSIDAIPTPPLQSAIRVLIVEDSALVQKLLTLSLEKHPDISVIGTAPNGLEALEFLSHNTVDIILLDIEMPVMDGITVLPRIVQKYPASHVIMCSTLTEKNAEISLHALDLGASDFIAKPGISTNEKAFTHDLIEKILSLAHANKINPPIPPVANDTYIPPKTETPVSPTRKAKQPEDIKALAIGCSTGGPTALKLFFNQLGNQLLHIPIFITQHMPPTFTPILAENLTIASNRPCIEAVNGSKTVPGTIYLAPGDYHMKFIQKDDGVYIHLTDDAPENFCRPAVDPMLKSLASIYRTHLLTLIMTGMGQDGLEGCQTVKATGGTIIVQDEESSVVWGMPGAVAQHNLSSSILPLNKLAPYIRTLCGVPS